MPTPRTRDVLLLSFLYFPLNLFWTAMTSQLLSARVEMMVGPGEKGSIMGLISAMGALMATFITLVIGPLSDNTTHHMGRRYPWVMGGILLGAFASLGFSLSESLWQLLLAFVLVRMGMHTAVAAYEALVPDRIPVDRQGQASGFAQMWDVLGLIFGTLATALLANGAITRLLALDPPLTKAQETRLAVFVICALAAGLFFLCLWMNLRWITGAVLPKEKAQPWFTVARRAFLWNPREAPDFTLLFISRCILSCGISVGFTYIRYYVQEALDLQGGDLSLHVMVISLIFAAGGIAGSLVAAWLGDKISKRKLLYFFCVVAAASAIGFCLTESVAVARLMAFGFGIGYMAISAVDWAFATNLVPPGKEGRYLAIFQCALTIPQIFVGSVGGFLGDMYGFRNLFWVIPVLLTAGTLVVSRVRERHEIDELAHAA